MSEDVWAKLTVTKHWDPESFTIEPLPLPRHILVAPTLVDLALAEGSEVFSAERGPDRMRLVVTGTNARAVYRLEYDIAHKAYRGTLEESEVDIPALVGQEA